MKQYVQFLLVAFACTGLVACVSENSPEKVTEQFCKAIYSGDFDQATVYCTEESGANMKFVKEYAADKIEKMKNADIRYEFGDPVLSDNDTRASVQVVMTGTINLADGSVEGRKSIDIRLVKNKEGKWLVNLKQNN